MASKRFVANVLRAIPELSFVDGYFYVSPVKHVLSGFVCNEKPDWVEVRQYVFPLFDRKGFLHLSYSQPALMPPNNLLHPKKVSDYSCELIELINPLMSNPIAAASLEGAISFLNESQKIGDRIHPLRMVSIGYAYILLGEKDRGIAELEFAADNDFVKLDKSAFSDCLLVLELAKNDGLSAAQELLSKWEEVTKNWLAAKGCTFN